MRDHPEPVRLGHVALADRDQAAEPRLGVEHRVVVERALARGPRSSRATSAACPRRRRSRSCAATIRRGARSRSSGNALPHHHQAGRQPGRVDEGEEVAGALERGGVVVVEEDAAVGLELVERVEHLADARRAPRRGAMKPSSWAATREAR